MTKSLKKNAFLNFVKCFMNIIFPIISFPYASRILMPAGIGKVNFVNSIIEYFLLIAGLGVSTYAAREAAKLRDDPHALNQFSCEILAINFIATLVAYGLLVVSFCVVEKFSEYKILLIICSAKILFTTAGVSWLFVAMEDYKYVTMRSIFFQGVSLVFLFLFVKEEGDFYQYAAMGVLSNVGGNFFNMVYARKYINIRDHAKLKLRKHLKPIFVFFGIDCADKLNSALDSVMLGFMLGDVSVGFYSVANKLCRMVVELVTSVISTFMPRSSYYLETHQLDEYNHIISDVFGVSCFFILPAAFGLHFLCKPLIILFSGVQYLGALRAMQILSIGMIGHCLNSFLNNLIITPQRKERFTFIARIIAACFNIVGNYFLIRRWDVTGAALATVIVEFLLPAVVLIPSFKYLARETNLISLVQASIGTAVMVVVLQLTFSHIDHVVLKTVGSVVVGSVVYALVELSLKNSTAISLIHMVKKRFC